MKNPPAAYIQKLKSYLETGGVSRKVAADWMSNLGVHVSPFFSVPLPCPFQALGSRSNCIKSPVVVWVHVSVSVCSQGPESALGRHLHRFLCIACVCLHGHTCLYLCRCAPCAYVHGCAFLSTQECVCTLESMYRVCVCPMHLCMDVWALSVCPGCLCLDVRVCVCAQGVRV